MEVTFHSEKYLPDKSIDAYSKKNRKIMKAITIWNRYNENVLEEREYLKANIEETEKIKLKDELPVMFFYVRGSKEAEVYNEYTRHLVYSEMAVIEGNHYLHWDHYKEIAKMTIDFLNK